MRVEEKTLTARKLQKIEADDAGKWMVATDSKMRILQYDCQDKPRTEASYIAFFVNSFEKQILKISLLL
ncbi:MAG TPA: hypothetical protein VFR70_00895 [Flavobacterium sp.]|nr:hypothetical protein [Flavobacterium sp.]